MEGNLLQGRSCSDLQQTAIVNRPTLAFCFSNKCVGLECKCATPLSALWPKELILLKAQQLSQPTCVGCQTFSLINLFPWWPFWGLLFSVLCSDVSALVVLRPAGLWHREGYGRGLCNSFCVCKQRSGIATAWSFLQVVCVHARVFVCQCYCLLSLSKKLSQLFVKMPNRQHRLCWESDSLFFYTSFQK